MPSFMPIRCLVRTLKHADYLDLFIAMTGARLQQASIMMRAGASQVILSITPPAKDINDLFWPLLGWLAGTHAPHQIPLITGLKDISASQDDLKGSDNEGHTAEADLPPHDKAIVKKIDISDMQKAWQTLNQTSTDDINLIAIGVLACLHIRGAEKIHDYMDDRSVKSSMTMIITVGRQTLSSLKSNGLYGKLTSQNCQIISDICWCSITTPLFPINKGRDDQFSQICSLCTWAIILLCTPC